MHPCNKQRRRARRGSTTTFDQDLFNNGLLLSLVGMGVVFAVLALLALSIKGLGLFDREPGTGSENLNLAAAPAAAYLPNGSDSSDQITGQQVAAVAVALALAEQQSSPATGAPGRSPADRSSSSGAGSWLQGGRMRSLGLHIPAAPARARPIPRRDR